MFSKMEILTKCSQGNWGIWVVSSLPEVLKKSTTKAVPSSSSPASMECYATSIWKGRCYPKGNDWPGMVLSKINATQPPTNMAVVRRTFRTWSMPAMPTRTRVKTLRIPSFYHTYTYPTDVHEGKTCYWVHWVICSSRILKTIWE